MVYAIETFELTSEKFLSLKQTQRGEKTEAEREGGKKEKVENRVTKNRTIQSYL